jgi:precorrin-2 dehydrogenase/sirohydrochlorin ferrochelatase
MEDESIEDLNELSRALFPIFLNLSGRLVVVVGGGRVGLRKAAALLSAGARIRVVDPATHLHLDDFQVNFSIQHISEPYRTELLDGACLAIAAATPEVNVRVVADAKARGIWVNSATDPVSGDFMLPSVVRSGDLTLAMSTSGAAPALVRRIRESLQAEFDDAFAEWVRVLGEVRPLVLTTVTDPEQRRELFDRLTEWSWLARIRLEGAETIRAKMLAEITTKRR